MTHIILKLEHLERVIEDFIDKHLAHGAYKAVNEMKKELHQNITAGAITPQTIAIAPQAPVAPDEQPDAAGPEVSPVNQPEAGQAEVSTQV